jgi:hypothetical protein
VRGEPSVDQVVQEPAGRSDRLLVFVHEFDAAHDAAITLFDHSHRSSLGSVPRRLGGLSGYLSATTQNCPDEDYHGSYPFHRPDLHDRLRDLRE